MTNWLLSAWPNTHLWAAFEHYLCSYFIKRWPSSSLRKETCDRIVTTMNDSSVDKNWWMYGQRYEEQIWVEGVGDQVCCHKCLSQEFIWFLLQSMKILIKRSWNWMQRKTRASGKRLGNLWFSSLISCPVRLAPEVSILESSPESLFWISFKLVV